MAAISPAKQSNAPTKNRANQFGTFAHDPNHQVFTQPNYPLYEDAAGTAVTSPVALTGTPQLINIPAAAVSIVILGAVAIRVSDTSGQSAGYFTVPANVPMEIPVVTPGNSPTDATGQLWLLADSTSGNCSFFFKCV